MITTLICSHFENIWLDHFRGQVRIKKKLICHTHHQITLGLIKYEGENEGKKWRGKIGCTVKLGNKELFGHPKIVP